METSVSEIAWLRTYGGVADAASLLFQDTFKWGDEYLSAGEFNGPHTFGRFEWLNTSAITVKMLMQVRSRRGRSLVVWRVTVFLRGRCR